MKFLISLYDIRKLSEPAMIISSLKKLDTFHLLDGIEIKANLDNPIEVVRLNEYASHLKSNALKMQVHVQEGFSNCYDDYVRLSKYIHIYGKLAETLQETLRITFHPVEDPDETLAIYKTLKLISKINALIAIYQYDIAFSLENLSAPRLDRVGLHTAIEKGYVGFCWDIEHDVMDESCDYQLSPLFRKHLSNVHIHDVNKTDHHTFIYGKTDYIQSLVYLHDIDYKKSIVVEVQYDHLKGANWTEKLENYMDQVCIIKNAALTLKRINRIM